MKKGKLLKITALIITLVLTSFANPSKACTRVVYKGTNGNYMTARSMDWKTEIPANLWVMPPVELREAARLVLIQSAGLLNMAV